ncbi:PqqD family protein [Dongia deserti]|uniref:PqqD family protein n=1 Tax=Dongia deserti TaxID=2268030 RepID=UPI000E650D67|nr:PqqD family protein [Dongia deserti]
MSQRTVLEIAAPQCVAQDFEGEVIVLNLADGTYYSLRELGAVLWRDLAAGHPVETLAAQAAGKLGGPQPVLDFVANATAQGLLRPAPNTASPTAEPQLPSALAGGGEAKLVFEVYEDMKTLILLDPVHEVDETRGWPNLPANT